MPAILLLCLGLLLLILITLLEGPRNQPSLLTILVLVDRHAMVPQQVELALELLLDVGLLFCGVLRHCR